MGARQQRVGLDREGARGCLHEPAATHATQLGGERGAAGGGDVLDHARAVHEVELVVGERQAGGGVGAHERAGVGGALDQIHARDVQVGLERAQAERATAEVEHARIRVRAR